MLLYFSIVGAIFYMFYLTTPQDKKKTITTSLNSMKKQRNQCKRWRINMVTSSSSSDFVILC